GLTILAGSSTPVGVKITGSCPGLELDRVSVSQAARTGVLFVNAAGEADNPILLTHVRVLGLPASDSGVAFQARHPLATKAVRLSHCQLIGPGKQAVLIDGPADGIEIGTSRLFNWEAALQLGAGLTPASTLEVTL